MEGPRMTIPIILVLLWVIPVVIHAVVVSRRKWGYHSFTYDKWMAGVDPYKYDGSSGRVSIFKTDEAGSYMDNFGMIMPKYSYRPGANWRTHHGMVDLHAKERPFPYFRPSWGDRAVGQWGEWHSNTYRDETHKQPLQSKQPDDGKS